MKRLPEHAREYITEHYPEASLAAVKVAKLKSGKRIFRAELVNDNAVLNLTFTEAGKMTNLEAEPRYFDDIDEGEFYAAED